MNTQTFNHTPHKCRKKLLSWLLVLCLCAGLLPVRVFAEQSIPCLEFALAIPTANSIPTADAAILTPGVLPTESFSVSWYKDSPDGDGPVHLKKNECVCPGTTYYVRIPFDLPEDLLESVLISDAAATINGEQAYFSFPVFTAEQDRCLCFKEAYLTNPVNFDVWSSFQVQDISEPEPPIYHVNIKPSENGFASADPAAGTEGSTVQLKAEPAPGHHLKSWSLIQANGAALSGDTLTIGSGDVTVAAEFAEDVTPALPFSITIERRGEGSAIASDYYGKTGDRIVLTATPDPGWQFQKWTLLSDNGAALNGNFLTIGTGNVNVRAEFAQIALPEPVYSVTAETDGHGTAAADPVCGKCGETVTLTAAADEGYQFKGWTLLHGEDAVLTGDLLTIGSGNVTVRADFEPLPPPEPIYTVTVETDGHGTASSSAPSGKYRDTVTLNATPNTGWRLKTWHIVQGMDSFVTDNVLTIGTENMTVRAEFEPGDPVYTCRWNANGGSWASGAVTRTGLSLPSPAPTQSGWTFSGWYTSPDGGDRLEDTPYFRSGRIDGLEDNIVFYAHWTQNAPTPSGGGGGGGGGGGSAAPAASPSVSGTDAAASSARFSSALTAGEQAVGRIRPRGLPALTPASAMPRTAFWLLRLLALLPGGAS